ncbi:hypothetical protein ABES25_06080 [Bacillus gobiensis]|uniref:hypothetical protein n=1 Tax=Bacillus gobiensis TaxID=1441095 RepID=UPI003D23B9B0
MAQNFVESHIQQGALHTFRVQAGKTVKIGEMVEVAGDRTVQTAGTGSTKAIGVVYSGTVGKDGRNVGYSGDDREVATVVVLKPFVFLKANIAITAGDVLKADTNGGVAVVDTATSNGYDSIGLALEGATAGERFLALLG